MSSPLCFWQFFNFWDFSNFLYPPPQMVKVVALRADTPATFLDKFRAATAGLGEEMVQVHVLYLAQMGVDLVLAVLTDPQAHRIGALHWSYWGDQDPSPALVLLPTCCPKLDSLFLFFGQWPSCDFVSAALERIPTISTLILREFNGGDIPRFFKALTNSTVTTLSIHLNVPPEFSRGMSLFLVEDRLVRLNVEGNTMVPMMTTPTALLTLLSGCTRLATLSLRNIVLCTTVTVPACVTKLVVKVCFLKVGVEWELRGVREFKIFCCEGGADQGRTLGRALSRLDTLDTLNISLWNQVGDAVLEMMDLGRISRLHVEHECDLERTQQIALSLPGGRTKELTVWYNQGTKEHLLPALRRSGLTKLSFYNGNLKEAQEVVRKFDAKIALLTLLCGRVRRPVTNPLCRLPVELFRMVGKMMI